MPTKNVMTKEMIDAITKRLIEMEGEELPDLDTVEPGLPDGGADAAWYIAYKTHAPVVIDVSEIRRGRPQKLDVRRK